MHAYETLFVCLPQVHLHYFETQFIVVTYLIALIVFSFQTFPVVNTTGRTESHAHFPRMYVCVYGNIVSHMQKENI